MNKIVALGIFLMAAWAAFSQEITTKVLHAPNQMRCNEAAPKLNQVLFGATPPNSDDKPVVVFVHGWFDNGYSWFMTGNDWYKKCYNAGYKTAFFFQSPSGTFQDNGQMVADMIRETCEHYNTSSVIAVCHSKGGFDTEWALYNSGVWDSVQGVITLSTPFWGAPIADLIANPGIRSALVMVPLVGPIFEGDGTYQMQPAYMAGVVRPMLDNHPNNRPEKFHCFGSWGYDHVLRIPNPANLDILMIVFPDARPSCNTIPGFNVLAGNLMSGFMNITGQLSKFVGVQEAYNNPSGDVSYIDGLAPYYSSIRPGAFNFSEPPPSAQSKINHLDVLYAFEMWDRVQPQIEYCHQNPVLRLKKENFLPVQNIAPDNSPVSGLRFIQDQEVSFTKGIGDQVQLILVGDYSGNSIQVLQGNAVINNISLNYELEGMFDAFHAVDLSDLETGKSYKLVCDKTMTALLNDGNPATLKIQAGHQGAFYSGDAVEIKASIENASENITDIRVTGYLDRNLDENGKRVNGQNIPVAFEYDAAENVFVCRDLPALPKGIYNISVFADGPQTHRFATSSIGILGNKKAFTETNQLKIYPNPARSEVTFSYILQQDDRLNVRVFDLNGKVVFEKALGLRSTGINSENLSLPVLTKGTYLVQLAGRSFHSQTKLSVF